MEEITSLQPPSIGSFLQHYRRMKQTSGNALLFCRRGSFYELRDRDAERLARELGLSLWQAPAGKGQTTAACGIPCARATMVWRQLLDRGFKLAIAEEKQSPALQGKMAITRSVVHMVTPACRIEDWAVQGHDGGHYVWALMPEEQAGYCLLAILEVSLGELFFMPAATAALMRDIALSFKPEELWLLATNDRSLASWQEQVEALACLSCEFLLDQSEAVAQPGLIFPDVQALSQLTQARVRTLWAAMEGKLQELKLPRHQFVKVSHLTMPQRTRIDRAALRDLEVFQNLVDGRSEGSLWHELHRCRTPMGSRQLAFDLAQPWTDACRISERQTLVKALMPLNTHAALGEALRGIGDIPRMMTRVLARKARPGDMEGVRRAVVKALSVLSILRSVLSREFVGSSLFRQFDCYEEQLRRCLSCLKQCLCDTPKVLDDGFPLVIHPDYHWELRQCLHELAQVEEEIRRYENELQVVVGDERLCLVFVKHLGLQLMLPSPDLAKRLPDDMVGRPWRRGGWAYTSTRLRLLSECLSEVMARCRDCHEEAWQMAMLRLGAYHTELLEVSRFIAEIDVGFAFADYARRYQAIAPVSVPMGEAMVLDECRLPLAPIHFRRPGDREEGAGSFRARSLSLSGKQCRQSLVLGPNNAGKTTLLRLVGMAALLHQIGCFVPARRASLPCFEHFFVCLTKLDSWHSSQSRVFDELLFMERILRDGTAASLVLWDELLQASPPVEGRHGFVRMLRELQSRVNCYALFSSHFPALMHRDDGLDAGRFACWSLQADRDGQGGTAYDLVAAYDPQPAQALVKQLAILGWGRP